MKKHESGLGSRDVASAVATAIRGKLGTTGASISMFAMLCGAPCVVSAQQAQTAPQSAAGGNDQLQEVVVTATRRSENIQSVPISVTAFTKTQMDVQGVKDIDDIARLSPSIDFSRGNGGFGSTLGNSISIRGMGATAGPATTGIYIDDTPVQVGATIASGSFTDNAYPQIFDLQRVEVLNGPQGTLFGSGSEGGAVRFITTPPNMTTPSVYVRSEVSDTQDGAPSYEAGVAGGAPLIADTLGFRASVWTRYDGGYVDRVDWYTGNVVNPNNNYQNSASARLAFGWRPIDGLTITPSIYYQRLKANGTNEFWLRGDGVTGSMFPGLPPLPVFQQPYGDAANGDYVDLNALNQWGDQRMTLPALKIDWVLPHDMEAFSNTAYYERQENGITNFASLEAGDWAGQLFPQNPDWTTPGFDSQGDRYFTQELRLQSTDANARLQWLVGAFYSRDVTTDSRNVYDPYLPELLSEGPYGCGAPATCMEEFFGATGLADGIYSFENTTNLTEKQKAVFAQASMRVVGGLSATVGLRYAKFDTDWINSIGGPVEGANYPGPGGVPQTGTASASVATPKYMLSYKTDHTLTYASATKGFRNGGVNAAIDNVSCEPDLAKLGLTKAPESYNPDSVWSYELGSKLTMLDQHLIVDAAVYQYDWSNMINNEELVSCTLSFTTNIGKAQGRGFELAVEYRPIDPLVLSMNAGYHYLKATQTLYATSGAIETQNGDTLSGGATVNAAAQYDFVVADRPAYFHVDYTYQGPQPLPSEETNPNDASYVNQPDLIFQNVGFSVTDARLGMDFGGWDVSLFCNNLLNAQPFLDKTRATVTVFSVPTSVVETSTIRPRTTGITAIYRF